MPRLFDIYLAIDWSARSQPSPARPSRDAIWVEELAAAGIDGRPLEAEPYHRTRRQCLAHLQERLQYHTAQGRRVLVGFDFACGYPAGFARSLGLSGAAPPWRGLWDLLSGLVQDDDDNHNNRFEVAAQLNARCGRPAPGPFWGCPAARQLPFLTAKMHPERFPYPVGDGQQLANLRWTDLRIRGVQPVWKLLGVGSVGSQSLVGIPVVHALRFDPALAAFSRVWPFETGFTPEPAPAGGPFILYAEIWPGAAPGPLDPLLSVRDQAQVHLVTRWLNQLDEQGQLGGLFDAPPDLPDDGRRAAVEEEGWILGVR